MYTPEQVRQCISWLAGNFRVTADGKYRECADILAATLKAAQGGVTDAMLDAMTEAWFAGYAMHRDSPIPEDAWSYGASRAEAEAFAHKYISALSAEPSAIANPASLGQFLADRLFTAIKEAALQSEAAPPAQQGEVVAWRFKLDDGSFQYGTAGHEVRIPRPIVEATPLYTAPPAQPAERVPEGCCGDLNSCLGCRNPPIQPPAQPAERVPEDTGRIDWMEANARSVSFGKAPTQGYWVHVQGIGYSGGSNRSLREAIDAARKAQAASPAPSPARRDGGEG